MQDLSSAQLATVLVGLKPALTQVTVLQLGVDCLQAAGFELVGFLFVACYLVMSPISLVPVVAYMPAPFEVRKELTLQARHAKTPEQILNLKMECVRKESAAERVWKERLLTICRMRF